MTTHCVWEIRRNPLGEDAGSAVDVKPADIDSGRVEDVTADAWREEGVLAQKRTGVAQSGQPCTQPGFCHENSSSKGEVPLMSARAARLRSPMFPRAATARGARRVVAAAERRMLRVSDKHQNLRWIRCRTGKFRDHHLQRTAWGVVVFVEQTVPSDSALNSPHVDARSMSALQNPELALEPSRGLEDAPTSITELLDDLRSGRREAFDRILPLVYHELRRAARRELAVRPSDTLFTTALVHELYLKFSRTPRADWRNRAHFLRAAGVAMRHILVDRARRRTAEKRGGPHRTVTLDDGLMAADTQAESLLELHEALDELAILDQRLARVVECRFFGGMTEQETAEALGVTERTVRRDWVKARGLLYQSLVGDVAHERPHISPHAARR